MREPPHALRTAALGDTVKLPSSPGSTMRSVIELVILPEMAPGSGKTGNVAMTMVRTRAIGTSFSPQRIRRRASRTGPSSRRNISSVALDSFREAPLRWSRIHRRPSVLRARIRLSVFSEQESHSKTESQRTLVLLNPQRWKNRGLYSLHGRTSTASVHPR